MAPTPARVAQCLHASAVVLDCLKQFPGAALPADLAPFQLAAHRRAKQLANQLVQAMKTPAVIPLTWEPADMAAAVPVPQPAVPPPPPPANLDTMFPEVPSGPMPAKKR